MKIGVLGWDYGAEDVDAPLLAAHGAGRGHDTVLFTVDDLAYTPAARGFEIRVGPHGAPPHDARSFDAVICRANLYGERWADRVERLTLLSTLPEVRVFDPVEAFLRGYSKLHTTAHLAAHGLPVPPVRSATTADDVKLAIDEWDDVVVKPSLQCAGNGVERVTAADPRPERVEELLAAYHTLVCSPFYPTRWGEYRITVAGDELPICMVKYPAVGQWMCRTPLGASFERFDVPDDLADLALRATRLMGLSLAGLDILPTADGYVILEVNPVPGNLDILGKAAQRRAHDALYDWVEKRHGAPD